MSDDPFGRRPDFVGSPHNNLAERAVSPSVLILEDEVVIAIDLEETLRGFGVSQIVVCHDLSDACSAADHHKFDLAILDHMIGPNSSTGLGRSLCGSGTKVVFTSGWDKAEARDLPQSAAFLAKPYSERQIRHYVNLILNGERIGQAERP